jgi:ppGpp synthetase/RelA/SpoT-type nucleotidyltranferase
MGTHEINRLGETLRNGDISASAYRKLAEFRESFHDSISTIYTYCCMVAETIEHDSLVVARLKRYSTIANKMTRFPSMKLSQLDDIAGCRIIFKDEASIYKFLATIQSNDEISILKVKDYIKEPRDSGYKSLHLIVSAQNNSRKVEIQVRTFEHHSWSTLVEITDTIFETKLKEESLPEDFFFALKALSKPIDTLTEKELEQIVELDKEKNYLEKVMGVFINNIERSTKLWNSTNPYKKKEYFIVTVEDRTNTQIRSYLSAKKAEREYLEIQIAKPDSNSVLVHLKKPTFSNLLRSYSNYVLVGNDLVLNYHDLLYNLIIKKASRRRYLGFMKHCLYLRVVIFRELRWFYKYVQNTDSPSQDLTSNNLIYFRRKHEERIKNAITILEKIKSDMKSKSNFWLTLFNVMEEGWWRVVHKDQYTLIQKINEILANRQEVAPDLYKKLEPVNENL